MRLSSLLSALLFANLAIPCSAYNLESKQFNSSSRSTIRDNMYNVTNKLFELHVQKMHHFIKEQKHGLKGLFYKLYNKLFNETFDGPQPLLPLSVYNNLEKHIKELQDLIRDNKNLWTTEDEQCAYEIANSAISDPTWENASLQSKIKIINEILQQHNPYAKFDEVLQYNENYPDFYESLADHELRRTFAIHFMIAMLLFEQMVPGGVLCIEDAEGCYTVTINNPF